MIVVDVRRPLRLIASIAAASLLAVMTALALSQLLREYRSIFSFYSDAQSHSLPAGLADLAASTGLLGTAGTSRSPQFFVAMLRTRLLTQRVTHRWLHTGGDSISVGAALLSQSSISAADDEAASKALLDKIEIGVDNRTGIITVEVYDRQPKVARAIATFIFDELVESNTISRQSTARARRSFLEDRLAAAVRQRDQIGDTLTHFLRANRSASMAPELAYRREGLEQELIFARNLVADLQRQEVSARLAELDDQPMLILLEAPTHSEIKARPSTGTLAIVVFPLLLCASLLSLRVVTFSWTGLTRGPRRIEILV